jgi:hypothetical protein
MKSPENNHNDEENKFWQSSNIMRDHLTIAQRGDLFLTYISARLIDDFKGSKFFKADFQSLDDINNFLVKSKFPLLTYDAASGTVTNEIQTKLYGAIKNEILSEEKIDFFLKFIKQKRGKVGMYYYQHEIAKGVAKFVDIKNSNMIADFNSPDGLLMREIIRKNQYSGEVYLYGLNKSTLKLAFVELYPLHKKIILNLISENESVTIKKKGQFDLVNVFLPASSNIKVIKKQIGVYENIASEMLCDGGQFLLHAPRIFAESPQLKQMRTHLLNKYQIRKILSLPSTLFPPSGMETTLLFMIKGPKKNEKIFVAKLSSDGDIDEQFQEIKYFHNLYLSGKNPKSFFPLVNTKNFNVFYNDFNINRFNPALEKIEREIKRSFPKSCNLKDICEIIPGRYEFRSSDYKQKQPGLRPLIRISDIRDQRVIKEKLIYVNPKLAKKPTLTKVNDILISVSGTIGKCAIVDENSKNSFVSKGLVILRPNTKKILPIFLLKVLSSKFVSYQLSSLITGTYIKYLPRKAIDTIKIPILATKEQKDLLEKLEKLQIKLNELKNNEIEINNEIKKILSKYGIK